MRRDILMGRKEGLLASIKRCSRDKAGVVFVAVVGVTAFFYLAGPNISYDTKAIVAVVALCAAFIVQQIIGVQECILASDLSKVVEELSEMPDHDDYGSHREA